MPLFCIFIYTVPALSIEFQQERQLQQMYYKLQLYLDKLVPTIDFYIGYKVLTSAKSWTRNTHQGFFYICTAGNDCD